MATLITGGTIITDSNGVGWTNTAAAFDGNTSQTEASSAAAENHGGTTAGLTYYIGKDWGVGNSHTVTKLDLYGPTNNSLLYGGATSGTIKLQGSNDGSSWTDLDSFASDGTNAQHITRTAVGSGSGSASIVVTNPYRMHRCSIVSAGTVGCAICEEQFYEGVATLTAAVGSFSMTGQAATLSRGKALVAAFGAFVFTGEAATLSSGHGHALIAAVGTFALTGIAMVLARLNGARTPIRAANFVLQKIRTTDPNLSD